MSLVELSFLPLDYLFKKFQVTLRAVNENRIE